jgi:hypothetical protein
MSVRMTRTAQASWHGEETEGGGRIGPGSGAYEGPFRLRGRAEVVERSTNPTVEISVEARLAGN